MPAREEASIPTWTAMTASEPEKQESEGPAPRREPAPSLSPVHRRLAVRLESELQLSSAQARDIAEILGDREGEIEALNARIRASGIFSRKQYSRSIREIWARSNDRIANKLDTRQNLRFREMLRLRELGDSAAFTIEPGMTVID